jgi:photosynthetic reaction center H subunit
MTGAITSYVDVAQATLYAFWVFFAGLIFYLRREDKREGYPLVSDTPRPRVTIQGFPAIPGPKTFRMDDGRTVLAPDAPRAERPINAVPSGNWPGAPLVPMGNPMIDGVGPAAWADRAEVPDKCIDGGPRIVPMRRDDEFSVAEGSPDPRGMTVMGLDNAPAGRVVDIWVDRAEMVARYLEVEAGARRVLLPVPLVRVDAKRGLIKVASVTAAHFAEAPVTADPERVTLREEDRIGAYFGGGHLYAVPSRAEPLL